METHDSRGSLKPISFGTLPATASTTSSSDVSVLIARCVQVYGERKGVEPRGMVIEWLRALAPFRPAQLQEALDDHIRSSAFWPTPADLIENIRKRLPPPQRKTEIEPRSRVLLPSEVAHRMEVCKHLRATYGFGRQEETIDTEPAPDPVVYDVKTSDASHHLRNSLAARRARNLV